MTRKAKPKKKITRRPARAGLWATWGQKGHLRLLYRTGWCLLAMVLIAGGVVGMHRLDGHVHDRLLDHSPPSALTIVDVPDALRGVADSDLHDALLPLMEIEWTDDRLCKELALRAGAVGWVREVRSVRRLSDARFEVRCAYRLPFAMVQQAGEFVLVDREGVRLPGSYLYDSTYLLVQGVEHPAPEVGRPWEGADLTAGLTLITALVAEPFSEQITAVLVNNFAGRQDRRRVHIELATDRAGGRIRWGSAPGRELEENTLAQKLALLRANFEQTGRVDRHHPVIDVSTFPDRISVPS
jgi:hypothetical protein